MSLVAIKLMFPYRTFTKGLLIWNICFVLYVTNHCIKFAYKITKLKWIRIPLHALFHYYLDTKLDLHRITSVLWSRERLPFRRTGFVPFGDLLVLQLLRPALPNLPCPSRRFTLNVPRYFLDFALKILTVNK